MMLCCRDTKSQYDCVQLCMMLCGRDTKSSMTVYSYVWCCVVEILSLSMTVYSYVWCCVAEILSLSMTVYSYVWCCVAEILSPVLSNLRRLWVDSLSTFCRDLSYNKLKHISILPYKVLGLNSVEEMDIEWERIWVDVILLQCVDFFFSK